MKLIIFDTETTGKPTQGAALETQPHICQFAAIIYEYLPEQKDFREIKRVSQIINPQVQISQLHIDVHGITNEMVRDKPIFKEFINQMLELFQEADIAIAHNLSFDVAVIEYELERLGKNKNFLPTQTYDSMKETKELCRLPGKHGNYKFPRLMELHQFLLGEAFQNAHNALADVEALGSCIKTLINQGFYTPTIITSQKNSPDYQQFSLF